MNQSIRPEVIRRLMFKSIRKCNRGSLNSIFSNKPFWLLMLCLLNSRIIKMKSLTQMISLQTLKIEASKDTNMRSLRRLSLTQKKKNKIKLQESSTSYPLQSRNQLSMKSQQMQNKWKSTTSISQDSRPSSNSTKKSSC